MFSVSVLTFITIRDQKKIEKQDSDSTNLKHMTRTSGHIAKVGCFFRVFIAAWEFNKKYKSNIIY